MVLCVINNADPLQVVGRAESSRDEGAGAEFFAAVRWQQDQQGQWQAVDLNTLINVEDCSFQTLEAHDINDNGWIVGAGRKFGVGTHAFLLTPIGTCPADVYPPGGDGCVNVDDLGEVFIQWGPCAASAICADTNGDCVVDVDDLGDVFVGWGMCPDCPAEGSEESGPESLEELIELMLELAAQYPELEQNIAEAIAALLEE